MYKQEECLVRGLLVQHLLDKLWHVHQSMLEQRQLVKPWHLIYHVFHTHRVKRAAFLEVQSDDIVVLAFNIISYVLSKACLVNNDAVIKYIYPFLVEEFVN